MMPFSQSSHHGDYWWPEAYLAPDHLQPSTLQWCHDGRDGVSNDQPHDYLFNRLFRR